MYTRAPYESVLRKTEGMRALGRSRRRLMGNVEIDFKWNVVVRDGNMWLRVVFRCELL